MEQRAAKILSAIIDEYIRTGEPVGSKALAVETPLAEKYGLQVSSATIRSTMAVLEQEGFLDHPHTSAGRVPTYKGFRYYIDNLMSPEPINEEKISFIDNLLGEGLTDEAIVENASTALAELTKCAAISTSRISKFDLITKVDVIPTGKRMYVLLLITSGGAVKNKMCRMEFDLTDEQMQGFTDFLNEHLRGVNLEDMSEEYIGKLSEALGSYMMALSPLLHAVYELSEEMMREEVEVHGEANLLACREIPPEEVMKFLSRKSELTDLLDDALSGISVRFGEENGTFAIENSTVVSANYYKDGKPAGTLGVVGPVRLDYRRVIPYIEYLSKKVSRMLSGDSPAPEIESKDGDNDDE